MSRVTVDASVIVKLFLHEEGSNEAAAEVKKAGTLLAPDLLWAEVGNILWKHVRRGDLAASDAEQMLVDIMQMPIETTATRDLIGAALPLAIETDRTVYDSLYLALAVQSSSVLLTADERLVNALADPKWGRYVRLSG